MVIFYKFHPPKSRVWQYKHWWVPFSRRRPVWNVLHFLSGKLQRVVLPYPSKVKHVPPHCCLTSWDSHFMLLSCIFSWPSQNTKHLQLERGQFSDIKNHHVCVSQRKARSHLYILEMICVSNPSEFQTIAITLIVTADNNWICIQL